MQNAAIATQLSELMGSATNSEKCGSNCQVYRIRLARLISKNERHARAT